MSTPRLVFSIAVNSRKVRKLCCRLPEIICAIPIGPESAFTCTSPERIRPKVRNTKVACP